MEISFMETSDKLFVDSELEMEEGLFPKLLSLVLAHWSRDWTEVYQHLEDRVKKPILHLVFYKPIVECA